MPSNPIARSLVIGVQGIRREPLDAASSPDACSTQATHFLDFDKLNQ